MRRSSVFGVLTLTLALATPLAVASPSFDFLGAEGTPHTRKAKAAHGTCGAVFGTATTEAIADNVFVGTIDDFELGGVHRPAWVTQTLSDVRISTEGAIKATAHTVFELDGNNDGICDEAEACFETTDQVRISGLDADTDPDDGGSGDGTLDDSDPDSTPDPDNPDLRGFHVQSGVAAGTGDLVDACGKLTMQGLVDFSVDPTSAAWRVFGRVCHCE